MSKSVVRSVKNVTKGYSSVQVKVRNATSNDAWGPTGQEMAEIAQMTYNSSSDFYEVMDMLDKRLNDKGKNHRHVLKSLKVLDYCLHEGSELVVTWARKNIYIIKTLREFQYVDEDNRDVGINVRTSAKELTSLILDEERLRTERKDRKQWKSRVTGLDEFNPPSTVGMGSDPSNSRRQQRRMKGNSGGGGGNNGEEDWELRMALEASKNQEEEDRKRRGRDTDASRDEDLERAMRLSKEEQELRDKQYESGNDSLLIDDTPAQMPQPTGYNQGYQQQSAVDFFGNPLDQQQPQSTGYLNNMYSQPTGMQYQQTGFQNGFSNNPYQQQQPTGFDQNYGQQAQYMQPQQTSFSMGNNPYGQQSNGFDQQFQPQPQTEQQQPLPTGSNNPWAALDQSQNSIAPQPTGSNNPFASSFAQRQQPSAARAPTLNTLAEQKTATQFTQSQTPFSTYASQHPLQPQQTAMPQSRPPAQTETDTYKAGLNAMLASGEGQDTFGNVGNMRIPAQHTAPGTFVNSNATTLGRLQPMQTGTNPFLSNQYTGFQGQGQQAQKMMPMQTGPGGFGGGGYGQAQQQGQRQSGGGGSLIDL